jgi:hypothetical protein
MIQSIGAYPPMKAARRGLTVIVPTVKAGGRFLVLPPTLLNCCPNRRALAGRF